MCFIDFVQQRFLLKSKNWGVLLKWLKSLQLQTHGFRMVLHKPVTRVTVTVVNVHYLYAVVAWEPSPTRPRKASLMQELINAHQQDPD